MEGHMPVFKITLYYTRVIEFKLEVFSRNNYVLNTIITFNTITQLNSNT